MRRFLIKPPVSIGAMRYLDGSDARHIRNVLRLKSGCEVELSDGKGSVYIAKITDLSQNMVETQIVRELPPTSESNIEISVAQAFLKGKKMDKLIRRLTELGISAWIPFLAGRSIPKPDARNIQKRMVRWKKIARESLKQCGRERTPEIGFAESFEAAILSEKEYALKIAFWEGETDSLNRLIIQPPRKNIDKIFAVFGPEGGFTAREIEFARNSGFITASLGPRILRTETATVSGCAILQYLFGDMGNRK